MPPLPTAPVVPSRRVAPPRPGRLRRFLVRVLVVTLGLTVVGGGVGGFLAYRYVRSVSADLPDVSTLTSQPQIQTSRLLARDGSSLIAVRTFDEDRDILTFDEFPTLLVDATISTEDQTFWENPGIDVAAILRAAINNAQSGEIQSGASTITQQLVKMLIGDGEQSIRRKVREAIMAWNLSEALTKEETLAAYLNTSFYGNGGYGVSSAARRYFNKPLAELSPAQITLLVGLPKSPSTLDPNINPEGAALRQSFVVESLIRDNKISRAEGEAILAADWELEPYQAPIDRWPWLSEAALAEAVGILGSKEALASCGCRIITTIDFGFQEQAEILLRKQVAAGKSLNIGNAAMIAQDPRTGDIYAYIGSADPTANTKKNRGAYDHAGEALRAPGSSWKPLVYLTAMEESGLNAASSFWDVSTEFSETATSYRPRNAVQPRYKGIITMRQALRDSRNIPAVRALQRWAGVPAMIEMAERLGVTPGRLIESRLGGSAALGTEGVTVRDMAQAYSTIAALGTKRESRLVLRIERAATGEVLYTADPNPAGEQVVDPRYPFALVDILRDNTTPSKAWLTGRQANINRPAILKTGTENDIRDTYAMGGVPQLILGVWYGNSDRTPMKAGSISGPLVLWQKTMTAAIKYFKFEKLDWSAPSGMKQVRLCASAAYNGAAGWNRPAADPACPFGSSLEWVIEGKTDPAAAPDWLPLVFGTYTVDARWMQVDASCEGAQTVEGWRAVAEQRAWQDDLDTWVTTRVAELHPLPESIIEPDPLNPEPTPEPTTPTGADWEFLLVAPGDDTCGTPSIPEPSPDPSPDPSPEPTPPASPGSGGASTRRP